MGLLNNPCRKCEFKDRCTDPAMMRSYVTSADEEGCPTFARMKNQTNISESWNALQAEQQEELNAMQDNPMDSSVDGFDANKLFADAFAEEDRKLAAERKLRDQLRRNNASVQNEPEEYDVFKGLRQNYMEQQQRTPQSKKMSKAAQKQAMLDAMSPAQRLSYLLQEEEKKQKALEKKEQARIKKELEEKEREETDKIKEKKLHVHQRIFWSIYLLSAVIGFICADEWWHYLLWVLGLIVLAIGRAIVRMITD